MKYQDPQMDIPKPELITKLKSYIKEAQKTPLLKLCEKCDYTQPELTYPQTKGEYITDRILTLLLFQSWIDAESEPILDEIFDIAGQLDTNVNQPEAWRKLFNLAQDI